MKALKCRECGQIPAHYTRMCAIRLRPARESPTIMMSHQNARPDAPEVIDLASQGMWRYRELLPIANQRADAVGCQVGFTRRSSKEMTERLARRLGIPRALDPERCGRIVPRFLQGPRHNAAWR